MNRNFTKLLLLGAGLVFGTQSNAQCMELTTSPNDTIVADAGSCGGVFDYFAIGHACGMFADFENGIPAGWTTGIIANAQDSWVIDDSSGTGIPLGSQMYGVPHTGNGATEFSFLQTPIFDATGGGEFKFDFYCDSETGSFDQEIIEVSYDGGATWIQMIGNQLPNNANAIQNTSFVVAAADGTPNTTVRFTYNTGDGCCGSQNGFFVDNVYFELPNTVVTQIAGLPSGSSFPVGTTMNTFVATDGVLSDTSSFTITVLDTIAPVLTIPTDAVSCSIFVSGIALTVTDDCPGTIINYTFTGATSGNGSGDASGSTFNPGVTTVMYTAADSSGNIDSTSFLVTVNASLGSETTSSCFAYNWATDGNDYTSTGMYTATLVNAIGCDSVVTLNLTIDTVDVNTSVLGADITAELAGATSYQWLDCDNGFTPVAGETNQTMTAIANGSYAVVIDNGTCVDTSACMAIAEVGVSTTDLSTLEVYPNPTTGNIVVDFGGTYNQVTLILRNIAGEIVSVKNVENSNSTTIEINASRGIYLLEVITNDGISNVLKVIKK